MAHLKKAASGHLLKSGDGHLVNDCVANTCNACDPPIPDTLFVTLSGLAGDLAGYDGKHTMSWVSGCIWTGGGGDVDMFYSTPFARWFVDVRPIAAGCLKQWDGDGGSARNCDPWNDTYSEFNCVASTCTDADTCTDSAGATCVVSLT